MTRLPTIPLGPHQVTRLIVGGNPLCGNSHYSETMSREMAEYYTPERVVEVLQRCEGAGINTVQARGDYHRVAMLPTRRWNWLPRWVVRAQAAIVVTFCVSFLC